MNVEFTRYKGFELQAAAIEIPGKVWWYQSSLLILERNAVSNALTKTILVRCNGTNLRYRSATEALNAAIAFAQTIIDGELLRLL